MKDIPIGTSNFREMIEYRSPLNKEEGFLYVDKSIFIREIIADSAKVIAITRPRRFGKTFNLSMLQHFYAKQVAGKPTAHLFKDLEIAKDTNCMQYQGKRPVIFISLKSIKYSTYEKALDKIKSIMSETYKSFREQLYSDKIPADEREYIDSIIKKTAINADLEISLKKLQQFLHIYYDVKPVVLIDEYDTPIQNAYQNNYYKDFIDFMYLFLGDSLKDNPDLHKAVLTGILRISKESIFSGLNNVEVYSILNENYNKHFGFRDEEINKLLIDTNLLEALKDTKEWYNGYNFGGNLVYNPWSILKFIKYKGELKSYWVNTSGDELIRNLIIEGNAYIKAAMTTLLAGDSITEVIDEHVVFGDLKNNPGAVWSLLLFSGYLKAITAIPKGKSYICELEIPNKEIEDFYHSIISKWFCSSRSSNWYGQFLNDLTTGDIASFADKLQTLTTGTLSYYDADKANGEKFYHGLTLGLVAGLRDNYEIKSNRESGKGRYDLALFPFDPTKLGILFEFKASTIEANLQNDADCALEQINNSKYLIEFEQRGIKKVISMGISFFGKEVIVSS